MAKKPKKSPGATTPGKTSRSGKPEPTHDTAAEQVREAMERDQARTAEASLRDRMVDIGRGNQQAGRQKS